MTNTLTTERLSQLILLKHDLLMQLRTLAHKQLEAIDADDIDRLLSVLAVKQPLLTNLQRVERSLDPFREQDPHRRQWRSSEDRRNCQLLADRGAQLLQELLLLEKQAETAALAQRDHTAVQLQATSGAFAAQQAYASVPNITSSGSLDLSSET